MAPQPLQWPAHCAISPNMREEIERQHYAGYTEKSAPPPPSVEQELQQLRRRVADLESLIGTPTRAKGIILDAIADALGQLTKTSIEWHRKQLDKAVDKLTTEVIPQIVRDLLEANMVLKIKEIWDETQAYRPGDGVVHGGAMWACIKATEPGERPNRSLNWRLVSKGDEAVLRKMLRDELKARGIPERDGPGYMTRHLSADGKDAA